jgi:hypothetical protein
MSRHLRHFAFAAAAACAGAALTAGSATAASAAATTTGQTVTAVPGEVTDVISSGFYMQDPHPVGGPFKQAVEVYTGSKPTGGGR